MRNIGRISNNMLNSGVSATLMTLDQVFAKAPNMASKLIRLYPQFSISMMTEGLGEIYGAKEKSDKYEFIGDNKYKWKILGNNLPMPKVATAITGPVGINNQSFVMEFDIPYYNTNDVIRLPDGTQLWINSESTPVAENRNSYLVSIHSGATSTLSNIAAGTPTGYLTNYHPEFSERGYTKSLGNIEEHINYLSTIRHSFSFSGDAASTKYMIEDVVNYKGNQVKQSYIADKLWLDAVELFQYSKEFALIYGKSTMNVNGKCFKQDAQGKDIITGDGIIAQMASSSKQTYNTLTIEMIMDILTDMSLRMPKKTGNEILVTTGAIGYQDFGILMRNELKYFSASADNYIKTKNGKFDIGGEFNSWNFQGNRLIVAPNNVFDNPNIPSLLDSSGRRLESSRMLFIDMSTYDGVRNIHLISKNGRSFIIGEQDGMGGQDGMTSGKVSTPVDGSSKHILGQLGIIMHNPYSSYQLEKKVAA